MFNASGRTGLAATVSGAVTAAGYTPGPTGNSTPHVATSTIYYPPGAQTAALVLGRTLGITATAPDPTQQREHLKVVLGSAFTLPTPLGSASSSASPAPGPAATTLADSISGGGIPCVK